MGALHQLIPMEEPGDVLSPSSASSYLACGFKWFGRHVLKLPDPPTGALTMGSAVHAAINANFEQKIETKRDLPPIGVKAVYDEAWQLMVKGHPSEDQDPTAYPNELHDRPERRGLGGEALPAGAARDPRGILRAQPIALPVLQEVLRFLEGVRAAVRRKGGGVGVRQSPGHRHCRFERRLLPRKGRRVSRRQSHDDRPVAPQ